MRDAVVILIEREGRYCLIRRAAHRRGGGRWAPPSGRVEPGETFEQAVIREAREELDADVRVLGKVWECPSHDGGFRLHWYLTRWIAGGDRPDPEEISELRWLPAADYETLHPIFPDDLRFFREVLPTVRL